MPLYQSLLVSASDRRFIAEHGYLNCLLMLSSYVSPKCDFKTHV